MSMENEELVALIKAGINVADNMLELWKQNKGFIGKMAMNYTGYAEIEDLKQEGYIGLCNAVEHYDPEKEVSFITYAAFWIKQNMQRYIENCTGAIRLPVYAKQEVQQYKRFLSEYKKNYGKEPTDKEIQGFLCVSAEKLAKIKNNAYLAHIRSLDEPLGEDDAETTLHDTLTDGSNNEEDIIKKLDTAAMSKELWAAVDSLPGNMPEVIRSRYKENKTLKETGESLGITIESVRQVQQKAERELRKPSKSKGFKPYYKQYLSGSPLLYVGVGEFNRTWTSSVEKAVLGW